MWKIPLCHFFEPKCFRHFRAIGIKFIESIDLILHLGTSRDINFEPREGFHFHKKKSRLDNCHIPYNCDKWLWHLCFPLKITIYKFFFVHLDYEKYVHFFHNSHKGCQHLMFLFCTVTNSLHNKKIVCVFFRSTPSLLTVYAMFKLWRFYVSLVTL